MKKIIPMLLFSGAVLSSCNNSSKTELTLSGLDVNNFRTESEGKKTDLFVLKNKNNMEVCITNFGGRIVSIMVPDKDGVMQDVVLGFESIDGYMNNLTDFGASIGRYANRINQGKFTIDGTEYQLPQNNFGHCLHGGPNGFQYAIYDGKKISDSEVELSYLAVDGEQGFPGNVACSVKFTLTDDNAIQIAYSAETDKPTVVNMTNHSYFNLDGDPSQDAMDYSLYINAEGYTPVDSTYMTTGEIVPVEGTYMDFRTPLAIGENINNFEFEQLKNGNGYDHNWVLNESCDLATTPCATMISPKSGIRLDVYTDEPGIQFYSGNFLDGTIVGKKGITYGQRAAVCLETQKYPDAPNKPEWPQATLRPGEKYTSNCTFKFSVAQ